MFKKDSTHTSYYKGTFHYAGLEFQDLTVMYSNDTLERICFGCNFGSKNREYANIIKRHLKEKYDDLENADSTMFAILSRNRFETDNIDTWSRKGGGMIVAAFSMSNYNQCVFSIEPQYSIAYDSAQVHIKELKIYFASYDSVNAVTAVAGIKFGDDIYTAKKILNNRSTEVYLNGNLLMAKNTNIGGVTYDYSDFTFHKEKGLFKVMFWKDYSFSARRAAELQYEAILKQYGSRYTNLKKHRDEEDNKLYSCGMYSSDYDYPPIFIMFRKEIDEVTGRTKYQIAVSYYIHKQDSIDNDEI